MGKNEIDIAVIQNNMKNIESVVHEGFDRIERTMAGHFDNIMQAIEKKADKDGVDKDIVSIKNDYNKILMSIVGLILGVVFAFIFNTFKGGL